MNAMQRLNELVKEKGPLLAGLDPDIEKLEKFYQEMGITKEMYINKTKFIEGIMREFCFKYIDAIKDQVVAIKINVAFFEAVHMEDLFRKVAEKAKKCGLFVIADAKRNDIGNTSKQYANSLLGLSYIDAITVNPFFGTDGVKPFLDVAKENNKAIFVLVKTSNPSSSEFQDLKLEDGKKFYEKVAEKVKEWGEYTKVDAKQGYSLVGAVVGATHPEEAKQLREQLPNTFFLVPGYGAQGASAEDIVVNFDDSCGGAIVNSSRGLMFAFEKGNWKSKNSLDYWPNAVKDAAVNSQNELLNAIMSSKGKIN